LFDVDTIYVIMYMYKITLKDKVSDLMKKLNNIFLAILICFTFAVLNINQVSAERGTSGNTSISNNSHVKKSGDRSKDYKNGGRESGGELSQGKKYEEAKEQIDDNVQKEMEELKNIYSIKENEIIRK